MKYAALLISTLLIVSCSSTPSNSPADADECANLKGEEKSRCEAKGISFGDDTDLEIRSKKKVQF